MFKRNSLMEFIAPRRQERKKKIFYFSELGVVCASNLFNGVWVL